MKLKNNLTFESFTQAYKDQYNHEQLWWLRKGYDEGLDISLYANPAFNSNQMFQIMYGLESGIDANRYARTDIDYRNMEELRYELEEQKEASY